MSKATTETTSAAQPQTLDAVASALGVTVTPEARAAAQLEAPPPESPTVAEAPPSSADPQKTPPSDTAAAAASTTTADAGSKSGQAAAEKKPDDKPKVPTAEEIAAVLDGPPKDAAAGEKKTGDALLDDPIPDEVKGRTRERMQTLLDRGRESHEKIKQQETRLAELEPLAKEAQAWSDIVVRSGLEPNDFATVMGTMAAINRGTVEQKRQALARIDQFRNQLATQLGETIGSDPLAGHDDLRKQVEDLEITQERAQELATLRNRMRAQSQLETADNERRQREEADNQAQQAAENELNNLQVQLVARDGEAAFNVRKHMAFKALQSAAPNLHPNLWARAFYDAYSAVPQSLVDHTLTLLTNPTAARPTARTNVVMQPGGAGGGGGGGGNGGAPKPQPSTTYEAVAGALGIGAAS